MVLNTITVGAAVGPTVIETYFSHYFNRKPLRQKPTAHVSYHEGLNLIRRFLHHASLHTIEELQAFTSQWVPSPRWVKVDEVEIPASSIAKAADAIISQLGHRGIDRVGGKKWWQWRLEGTVLKAEWIEMRAHHAKRTQKRDSGKGDGGKRVMLYVHGGAYFFGSVDEHRYQMQRHARKLEARVLAPRYRLAPQFPFPCGLLDCLAAYIYLLTVQDPTTIILAGDSAGGGMVLSMLVILRDMNIPLPAGAILISPWVDLTHSFPSVAGDASLDYIPSHGFFHRPSAAWPPPNADDIKEIAMHAVEKVAGDSIPRRVSQQVRRQTIEDAVQGFSVNHTPGNEHPVSNPDDLAPGAGSRTSNILPGSGRDLSIMLDGNLVEIKDQIQIYATNQLISHPLVSPVLTPILGGLPPLLILSGGGEILRDEQIYLAHKAANPLKYPPDEAYLNENPEARKFLAECKPTNVQLQVWDDLCHVAPTLSFTRPAKYMYRSIAQFGAWALAQAQDTEINVQDPDEVSVISSGSDTESEKADEQENGSTPPAVEAADAFQKVGRAGESLPPFKNHMIRQRVDRHGNIYPLAPSASFPALQMPPSEIGVIKPGPVRKWTEAKQVWDTKYAKEKRKVQKRRAKEMAKGYQSFGVDEVPPPSALAGRRGLVMPKEKKKKRSWGMSLWSVWGSSHDEKTMAREEKVEQEGETTSPTEQDKAGDPGSDIPDLSKNIPPSEYVRHGNPSDFKKPYVKGEPLKGILKKPKPGRGGPSKSAEQGEAVRDDQHASIFGG